MNKIKELQEKLKKLFDELKALDGGIEKAADDEAKKAAREAFEAKRSEVEACKKALDEAVAKAEQDKATQASLDKAASYTAVQPPAGGSLTGPAEPRDTDKELVAKEGMFLKYMSGGARIMSGEEMKALSPAQGKGFSEQTEGGVVAPASFGIKMFGLKWARDVGYTPDQIRACMKASTMVSSSDALGGYTVPEDFRLPMLSLATEAPHIMQRATVLPCPTGEITMPRAKQTDSDEYGGMVGSWVAEGGLKPKTDTRFEQVKIAAHEYAMYTQISIRLLNRSAIAMENWINTRGRQVCMDALDQAFINGDGTGKPLGILQTDGIRQVKRQTKGTVTRRDTIRLKYKLKPYHRAGAIYIMGDDVLGTLEELVDTQGRGLFQASMANGPYDRLNAYPYVPTTRTPVMGQDGDMIFVDPREYYIPMEQDIVIKRSDDYDIVHNLATIVIFVVVGGKLVQPRVAVQLGDDESS